MPANLSRRKMEFERRHYRRRVVRSQPSTRPFNFRRGERSCANCDSLPSKSVRYGERNMSELADRQCVPCRGGVPPLNGDKVQELLGQLADWQAVNEHHLLKTYRFEDFRETLAFVNRVGELAEEQGHHPDICFGWGKAEISIWTHKIDGLTESDFVLAAKIDKL